MIVCKLVLIVPLLTCVSAFAQTAGDDPCEAQVPADLKGALKSSYPEYRLAQVAEYDKEDVDQHRENFKGNPCLSVASADVDGDGSVDFALIIRTQAKHTLLVAARNVARKS
jgi:hypothetical protein